MKQEQVGELQNQAQEAEGRLEQVMTDLAKGTENSTPDMAKVQELEAILMGIWSEESKEDGPARTTGQGDGGDRGRTLEEPHPVQDGKCTPKGTRGGRGASADER